MARLYKLTDPDGLTRPGFPNETKWEPGKWNTVEEGRAGKKLCSADCLHAYENPWLAVLLNPQHAWYNPFRLWEAEGRVTVREGYLKVGCKRMRVMRELKVPKMPTMKKLREFILRVALEYVKDLRKRRVPGKKCAAALAVAEKKLRLRLQGKEAEATALPFVNYDSGLSCPLWDMANGTYVCFRPNEIYAILEELIYRKTLDVGEIAFKVFGKIKPLPQQKGATE